MTTMLKEQRATLSGFTGPLIKPEGKPYNRQYISKADLKTIRKMLSSITENLPVGVDLQEAVVEKIKNHELLEPLPAVVKDGVEYVLTTLNKSLKFIDISGMEIVAQDDPLYQETREAVEAYNEAHGTDMKIPALVIRSEDIPGIYVPVADAVAIGDVILDMPTDARKAVIAHELAHKRQAENGEMSIFIYDRDQHIAMVSSELEQVCAEAGVSLEDLGAFLPSNAIANLRVASGSNTVIKNPLGTMTDPVINGMDSIRRQVTKWLSPWESFKTASKISKNSDCDEAINRVDETFDEAVKTTIRDSLAALRGLEYGADTESAQVLGPMSVARALMGMSKDYDMDHGDETDKTHPNLTNRLENIGCRSIANDSLILCHTPKPQKSPSGQSK